MSLLIDGYNLLHASGILGRGLGPGGLQRARTALLNFVVESVDANERTTVVFDAAGAPPGLPRLVDYRGVTVYFAAGYEDADALIEELIRADSAPRKLTVVSSDHRLQRAARRRRAKAIDSRRWYDNAVRIRDQRRSAGEPGPAKPLPAEYDVEFWLNEFSDNEKESTSTTDLSDDIFPPGYAEDLLD